MPRIILPRWAAQILGFFVWFVIIPAVHGGVPWLVSRLAVRHGWVDDRPGMWNWLGLIPVALGVAGLAWVLASHIPPAWRFKQVEVELTPKYLVTRGPYAYTRHPMYVSVLLLWLGWAAWYGSFAVLSGAAVVLAWVNVILPHEERRLEARFGDEYRQFKRTVPRWFGRRRQ